MATYEVQTEKGTYHIETEDAKGPDMAELQAYDKPIQPVGLRQFIDLPFQAADIAGEKGAEFAASHGVNPTIAATAGTALQMAPYLTGAAKAIAPIAKGVIAEGLPSALETLGTSARSSAEAVGNAIKNIPNTLRNLPGIKQAGEFLSTPSVEEAEAAANSARKPLQDALARTSGRQAGLDAKYAQQAAELRSTGESNISPVEQELNSTQEKLGGLGDKYRTKEEMLTELQKQHGKGIEAAEKEAGIGMDTIPQPVANSVGFANKMKAISEMSPEELAQTPIQELQHMYKQGQMLKRGTITPEETAFINRGMASIDQVRSSVVPKVGQQLSKWRETTDAIESLPTEMKAEKESLTGVIKKLKSQADDLKSTQASGMRDLQTAKTVDKANLTSEQLRIQGNIQALEEKLKAGLEAAHKKAELKSLAVKSALGGALGALGFGAMKKFIK